jgi:hypothetical protein
VIELGHGFDHLTGEQLQDPAHPDDASRLQSLDRLDERRAGNNRKEITSAAKITAKTTLLSPFSPTPRLFKVTLAR